MTMMTAAQQLRATTTAVDLTRLRWRLRLDDDQTNWHALNPIDRIYTGAKKIS
uniref:Uncharacterized protein n=1 Tax=Oryza sativa subsp. japonica TaxID=39947 RepID=Q94I29_ORYSJ|nr:Hypothetical protein [Oryza sativa Japonica Group]